MGLKALVEVVGNQYTKTGLEALKKLALVKRYDF
jgi:hypothetical protein